MGIIFAVLAAISQAVGFVVLKRSYRDFPPAVAFLFLTIFGILLWIPFAFVRGFSFDSFGLVLFYSLVSTVLGQAYPTYMFSKGDVNITGSIFATYPAYTVLFSLFINGETLSPAQWLYVVITIAGTVLISIPSKFRLSEIRNTSFILYPISAALTVGLADSLTKRIIDQTSVEVFFVGLALTQIPVSLIFLKLQKQSFLQFRSIFNNLNQYKYSIIASFCIAVVLLFLFLSFSYTKASIAAPISGSYPALMVFLAWWFLKEQISKKNILGTIIVIVGVIGLGISS